jgi:hypothetical protein
LELLPHICDGSTSGGGTGATATAAGDPTRADDLGWFDTSTGAYVAHWQAGRRDLNAGHGLSTRRR